MKKKKGPMQENNNYKGNQRQTSHVNDQSSLNYSDKGKRTSGRNSKNDSIEEFKNSIIDAMKEGFKEVVSSMDNGFIYLGNAVKEGFLFFRRKIWRKN